LSNEKNAGLKPDQGPHLILEAWVHPKQTQFSPLAAEYS
jgi:hypothetical protein